ncbi:lysogenization regulator [Salinisphaera sp. PC39]|uniref:lysogenization protein HflD n=1 Tax=Salinisphaera sp. PC39 TaxID=1304156 RepID=UPI00333E934B
MSRIHDQVLALAGVAQFALYAHGLAAEGIDRRERLDRALHAVFSTDPEDAAAVFGGADGVADGLAFLERQLRGAATPDTAPVARYIGQVLRLSGRLLRNDEAMTALRGAIGRARLADPEQVTAILDNAYRESVSPVKPRIMVQGHPTYLQNEEFARRIRTHLLASVRSAVLWRQCGGRLWQLLFQRRKLLSAIADVRGGQAAD